MKFLLILILVLFTNSFFTQTGPGGVGNSSNNLIWLSSDNITGKTDGVDISTWPDLSGNGNDLSQPNSIYTPIYKTNIINGKPTVRFNKTDGRLRKTGFTTFPSTEITAIFVNINNGESNDGILSYASSAHNNDFLLFNSASVNLYRIDPRNTATDLNNNVWNIASFSWKSSGGNVEAWKNGSKSTPAAHKPGSSITAGGCLSLASEQDAPDASYDAAQAHFGDFTEVLIYNTYLNETQNIIIANYLSAKYNIALTTNDLYLQDASGAGNFDHEVAGIGRLSATDLHNDAQGSSIVRILNPTNLDDNEFLIWGHNNATLGTLGIYGTTDYPPTLQGRLQRVWRVSERNKLTSSSADVGNIDIRFDLSGLGSVTASDLRLLIDSDNDGVFIDEAPISGASLVSGSIYQFTAQSGITDNLRFTIGTIDTAQTPLPIELLSFDVTLDKNRSVHLNWTTLSEIENDYFTIEKSKDALTWEKVSNVNGAGNSNSEINYQSIDENPSEGINYYRLKQTDFNGVFSYSSIKKVNFSSSSKKDLHVYPNPSKDIITIYSDYPI